MPLSLQNDITATHNLKAIKMCVLCVYIFFVFPSYFIGEAAKESAVSAPQFQAIRTWGKTQPSFSLMPVSHSIILSLWLKKTKLHVCHSEPLLCPHLGRLFAHSRYCFVWRFQWLFILMYLLRNMSSDEARWSQCDTCCFEPWFGPSSVTCPLIKTWQ